MAERSLTRQSQVLGEFDTFINFYVVHLPIIKLKTSNDGLMDDGLMDN
jgi:hypothetical protein